MPYPPEFTVGGYLLMVVATADPAVNFLRDTTLSNDPPAGWTVVSRPDGVTVAMATSSGGPVSNTAVQAVLNADLTASGVAAFNDTRFPTRRDLRLAADQAIADIDAFLLTADAATAAQVRVATKRLAQMMRLVIMRLRQID